MNLYLKKLVPYLFLSPFLILFGVFGIFPLFFSFYLAFHSWDPIQGVKAMHYVGFANFKFSLGDPWFWKSLKNTFWLAIVSGVPQHLIAIPLACFLNNNFNKYRNLVIGSYFLPYITSTVAIAILFSALFSKDYGSINLFIHLLSKTPIIGHFFPATNIDWLGRSENIKPAISVVVFWRYIGFNTVLYLAALKTIPKELYEAATMDGASVQQQFWKITLPQLKPVMYFAIILSIVGGLQLFEEPFVLTGGKGGADLSGMTTSMYLYKTAFEYGAFGVASSISWILFGIVTVLTFTTHKIFKEKDFR